MDDVPVHRRGRIGSLSDWRLGNWLRLGRLGDVRGVTVFYNGVRFGGFAVFLKYRPNMAPLCADLLLKEVDDFGDDGVHTRVYKREITSEQKRGK